MGSARDLLPRWLVDHHDAADTTDTTHTPLPPPSLPPPPFSLTPWDDGFTPSGCNNRPCKMITQQPRATPSAVRVVDGAVHAATADLLYASAVRAKVWGVYVPMHNPTATGEEGDTNECRRTALKHQNEASMDRAATTQYRTALARLAVDEFLVAQGSDVITRDDWDRTHGVAVWVIASDCDDETEYHLDYAEMLRFETNVIFPPIYGATLHVSPLANEKLALVSERENSPLNSLAGGGFYVNTHGLDHYRMYGYKTRRATKKLSTDQLETIATHESGWQQIPYQYCRGIICDGQLPHFSARVRSLPPSHKRVVVGFNLFPHVIGSFVEKFPEHSEAFNKHVKLAQTAARQPQQVWSLESLKKNPKQAAFLKYLARKVREKQSQKEAAPRADETQHPRSAKSLHVVTTSS